MDLEGGTENGIRIEEARMGGIGRGKGRVEEPNMIETVKLFLAKDVWVLPMPHKFPLLRFSRACSSSSDSRF